VYILRAVGQAIMGPIDSSRYTNLTDGTWNEKFAASVLVIGIMAIGIAPFWLHSLLAPGAKTIIQHIERSIAI
jgi:NADH-quinone oxidoreductase subunit M